MSTLKTDAIEAATGTNTDLSLDGKGSGVPDLAAGFKVGSVAGVPTASIRDDAVTTAKILNDNVTLAKLAAGTDGELITWDAAGDPATVAVGTATHILTSNGAGAAPTFQAAAGGGYTNGTEYITTSGTAFDWTGIPSGTTSIYVGMDQVSLDNNEAIVIQIGDSGGFETSGYESAAHFFTDTAVTNVNSITTGFTCGDLYAESDQFTGYYQLVLVDPPSNLWAGMFANRMQVGKTASGGGVKHLSGELTQVRLTRASGNFDKGSANIGYL